MVKVVKKQKSEAALRKEASRQKLRDLGLKRFNFPEIWGTEAEENKVMKDLALILAKHVKRS